MRTRSDRLATRARSGRLLRRAALAALLLAGTAQAAGALHDPADPGTPLDLAHSALTESGQTLDWHVTLAAPLPAGALLNTSRQSLCLFLSSPADAPARQRVCVHRVRKAFAATLAAVAADGSAASARPLAGAHVHPDGDRSLDVSFPASSAGLAGKALGWQARTRVTARGGCTAAAGATGSTGPTGTTGATDAPPALCVDLAPDQGTVAFTTTAAIPTGCMATGTPQVTGAPGSPNAIALTFDDGPSPYTPQVLTVLEREHVPGTFFMVGKEVAGHGADLRRELRDGDALGNHSWNHANLGAGGPAATEQITSTNAVIRRESGGYTPCLFRPPYGATSPALVGDVRAQGMTSVLWNVDPRDWSRPGVGSIVATELTQTRRGSIIIMHDGGGDRSQTVAALPTVIAAFRRRGYRFLTVPELLGYPNRF